VKTHLTSAVGDISERGFTLLETIVSLGILAVVAAGILPLAIVATKTTENQGHLMARTTEYAQDKLEQLLALSYGDSTSDTRVFPATPGGGSGLAVGGSVNQAAPIALYADYLDIDGNVLTGGNPPANWYYQRIWQVSLVAGRTGLKQVSVRAIVRTAAAGGSGLLPQSVVTALKTSPF